MSQGARNWPFLTLTALPVLAAAISRSVCRHKKGGDLQHVDRGCDARALLGVVHVGEHRNFQAVADLGEDRQRRVEAEAALALAEVRLALSNEVL